MVVPLKNHKKRERSDNVQPYFVALKCTALFNYIGKSFGSKERAFLRNSRLARESMAKL